MTTAAKRPDTPLARAVLSGDGADRRILVVDDDAETRALLEGLFPGTAGDGAEISSGEPGYTLDFISNGPDACERVKNACATGHSYTTVCVGHAPSSSSNGLETLARILDADPDVQVMVLLASGQDGVGLEEVSKKIGRSDRFVIMRKPLSGAMVKQMVAAFAAKWEMARHHRETNHRWRESEQCHLMLTDELENRVSDQSAELASARMRLEHLLRCSPAVIYSMRLTNPPSFTFVSDNITTLLGYKASEMLADSGFWIRRLHPDDAVHASGNRARRLEEGRLAVDFRFMHRDGAYRWVHDDSRVIRDSRGLPTEIIGSLSDITDRKRVEEAWREGEKRYRNLIESQGEGVVIVDADLRLLFVNPAAGELFRVSPPEALLGRKVLDFVAPDQHAVLKDKVIRRQAGEKGTYELGLLVADGARRHVIITATPQVNDRGEYYGSLCIFRDITERLEAEKEIRMMDMQLRQAQKLEAIGQLAAGIAHEINTPAQYVGDNTRFLKDAFVELEKILHSHQELLAAAQSNALTPQAVAKAREILDAADLGYLFEQVPSAINETLEGVERVTKIVRAMKEFSHPGGKEKSAADINKAIESTVTVARNEWKYVAEIKLELDSALPMIPCFVGEFNQVILNLIINASHAIGDAVKERPGEKGLITISTRRDGEFAEIRVGDTGTGIPENIRSRIFDPFFTTKEAGKGTGQGLSIVYGSIAKKHGGTVTFESEVGKGTIFLIRLPLGEHA